MVVLSDLRSSSEVVDLYESRGLSPIVADVVSGALSPGARAAVRIFRVASSLAASASSTTSSVAMAAAAAADGGGGTGLARRELPAAAVAENGRVQVVQVDDAIHGADGPGVCA